MINSSINELDEISKDLKNISHKLRPLHSSTANIQEGIVLSAKLYQLSVKLNNIARALEDDGK